MAVDPVLERAFINNVNRAAARAISSSVENTLANFFEAMGTEAQAGKDSAAAHKRLAEAGQAASIAQFELRRSQSEEPMYRIGENRISGGRLLSAIRSPRYARSDADGIAFADKDFLRSEAVHWGRINYSAGRKAPFKRVTFRVGGRAVGYFAKGNRPGPKWKYPTPFEGGPGVGFFPLGKAMETVSKTHKPYYYIEAGIEAIAENLDREYSAMFDAWATKAARRANAKPPPIS